LVEIDIFFRRREPTLADLQRQWAAPLTIHDDAEFAHDHLD
jgi:hypothetical protein